MILVVEQSPCLCISNSLPLSREQHFCPVDYRLEVKPEVIGILVMLVNRHVHLPRFQTVTVSNPRQCFFQQFLPNRVAFQVSVSHFCSNTVALREIVLGIRQPRTCISSVQQFLRGQHCTSDVDALKPFQLLGLRAFTDIYGQLVVQNRLLFLIGQILKKLVVAVDFDGEILVDILRNGNRPLLSVENLV